MGGEESRSEQKRNRTKEEPFKDVAIQLFFCNELPRMLQRSGKPLSQEVLSALGAAAEGLVDGSLGAGTRGQSYCPAYEPKYGSHRMKAEPEPKIYHEG